MTAGATGQLPPAPSFGRVQFYQDPRQRFPQGHDGGMLFFLNEPAVRMEGLMGLRDGHLIGKDQHANIS